jgi:ribonuclease P protein component
VLPAAARIRRRSEFTAAVRTGRRASTPLLTLHVASTSAGRRLTTAQSIRPLPESARAGFVVPRSVGPAVVRNAVRRRLRHLLRERLVDVPAGTDVVVRVAPAAARASSEELAGALDTALRRALAPAPMVGEPRR